MQKGTAIDSPSIEQLVSNLNVVLHMTDQARTQIRNEVRNTYRKIRPVGGLPVLMAKVYNDDAYIKISGQIQALNRMALFTRQDVIDALEYYFITMVAGNYIAS